MSGGAAPVGGVLALADFAGMDEAAIKAQIAADFEVPLSDLDGIELVVAYMSEGSGGCDSDAFIVFRKDGKLYEVNGGHCSCYGFEGQWEPEETNVAAIIQRQDWAIAGGGYDSDAAAIRAALSNIEGANKTI